MLLILISLLSLVAADCPAGFDDNSIGGCVKIISNITQRADAARACAALGAGGTLASIQNGFINTMVLKQAQALSLPSLWIGLECLTNSVTNCQFDDATTMLTTTSYTNFYSGNPSAAAGTCVYMSGKDGTTSGKWFSSGCDVYVGGYACIINSGTPVNSCSAGYGLYNNECYKVIAASDEPSAEVACEQDCGHITSVLSADENKFVLSLAQNYAATTSQQLYARIGLKTNGSNNYYWEDGTRIGTYSNWGAFGTNSNLGNCVGMALSADIVSAGQWINTKCDQPYIAVCKKENGYNCYVATTQSTVTKSPVTCSSPSVLNNNGTFFSPGYPYRSATNVCYYIMTVPNGYVVKIHFPILTMDCSSSIELYNDIGDTTPFTTITSSTVVSPNTYYSSNENEMKMIFRSSSAFCSTGAVWEAEFFPLYVGNIATTAQTIPNSSGCNQGGLTAPGAITSPNYPNNYPNNANCQYLLEAPAGKTVKIHFTDLITEPGVDIVTVYDGSNDGATPIARLSGDKTSQLPLDYTSSGNQMFVTFFSDSMDNAKGFYATFTTYN